MKKLCIFDFDGTLFDSLTDVTICFNKTFESLGYKTLDKEEYKKSLGGNVDEIIALILGNNNTPENRQKVKDTYTRTYEENEKVNSIPFKGIPELLENLQNEKYTLAINSNRTPDSIKQFVNQYLDNITFLDIQGHVDTKPSKPDPFGVLSIVEQAKLDLDDVVYIGDSATDVQTAKNAGIDCILVKWGYGVGNIYEDEYILHVVNNTDELREVIKNS